MGHLINSDLAETTVKDIDGSSKAAAPWRKDEDQDSTEEVEEEEEIEEEMPGMSMKAKAPEVVPVKIGIKEKKAINRAAISQLHKSKAFKTKEALKAKKQRNAARFKKEKKSSKRALHAKVQKW